MHPVLRSLHLNLRYQRTKFGSPEHYKEQQGKILESTVLLAGSLVKAVSKLAVYGCVLSVFHSPDV